MYFAAGDEEKFEIEKSDEAIQKDEIKDKTKAESLTVRKNEVEMKETKKIIKDENDVKNEISEESEVKEEEKEVENQMENDTVTKENDGDVKGE